MIQLSLKSTHIWKSYTLAKYKEVSILWNTVYNNGKVHTAPMYTIVHMAQTLIH